MESEGHKCFYYEGKIRDVTFCKSEGSICIYCRRCGKLLKDDEVDPKTLKEIKQQFRKKW